MHRFVSLVRVMAKWKTRIFAKTFLSAVLVIVSKLGSVPRRK